MLKRAVLKQLFLFMVIYFNSLNLIFRGLNVIFNWKYTIISILTYPRVSIIDLLRNI